MEAVLPALAAVLLCSVCAVVALVRTRRSGRRSVDRAHLVEQALMRARDKQRTIIDKHGDDRPNGPQAV